MNNKADILKAKRLEDSWQEFEKDCLELLQKYNVVRKDCSFESAEINVGAGYNVMPVISINPIQNINVEEIYKKKFDFEGDVQNLLIKFRIVPENPFISDASIYFGTRMKKLPEIRLTMGLPNP